MVQMTRAVAAGLMTMTLCAGCGGTSEVDARPAADAAAPAPNAVAAPVAASSAPAVQDATAGAVSFTVDGRPKQFGSLPAGLNTYTPLASTITATPSADAGEQLTITFLSMDLRKLEYPVDLPPRRTAGAPMTPLAAMASVGLSYRDESGREWAGPGRIRIEAYGHDGVVVGTFSNVSLPHTEKTLPDVRLDAGEIRVRISAPW